MGLRKLVVCVIASFVAGLLFLSPLQTWAQTNFSDLDKKDWGYEEIQYLVGEHVLTGYPDGSFKPKQPVKRKEAATMVGKAFDLNGKERKTVFPDVDARGYASGYIQSSAHKGYITGYPDGTFRPNHTMKRDEMAYLVSRAFSLEKMGTFLPYTDIIQEHAIFKPINKVTTAGITNGYKDGTFKPDAKISRREFALMIARAMNPKFIQTESQSIISEGVVTADILNVRQGPSKNYHVVGKLKRGTPVKIYEKIAGWGFVSAEKVKGFVSLTYIGKKPKEEPVKKPELPLSGHVITIDPGHGGSDVGATDAGVYEKDINLAVSKMTAQKLEELGAKVVLTRKVDDQLVNGFSLKGDFSKVGGLQARVDISKKADADAFVSIHTNSCCGADGTETYYHTYSTKDQHTERSQKLAEFIQARMIQMTEMDDRGVKRDSVIYDIGFHVLRENPAPSALVELGFITTKEDRQRLVSEKWQNTAAKAITLGIQDYFKWLEAQQK